MESPVSHKTADLPAHTTGDTNSVSGSLEMSGFESQDLSSLLRVDMVKVVRALDPEAFSHGLMQVTVTNKTSLYMSNTME